MVLSGQAHTSCEGQTCYDRDVTPVCQYPGSTRELPVSIWETRPALSLAGCALPASALNTLLRDSQVHGEVQMHPGGAWPGSRRPAQCQLQETPGFMAGPSPHHRLAVDLPITASHIGPGSPSPLKWKPPPNFSHQDDLKGCFQRIGALDSSPQNRLTQGGTKEKCMLI